MKLDVLGCGEAFQYGANRGVAGEGGDSREGVAGSVACNGQDESELPRRRGFGAIRGYRTNVKKEKREKVSYRTAASHSDLLRDC